MAFAGGALLLLLLGGGLWAGAEAWGRGRPGSAAPDLRDDRPRTR